MNHKPLNPDNLDVGAFEIATLAVQLAELKGERRPALREAVDLLILAHDEALRVARFNSRFRSATMIWHDRSPLKGDPSSEEYERSFDGAEMIKAPDEPYPGEGLELITVFKAIFREKNEERCFNYRDRFARYVYKHKEGKSTQDIQVIRKWGRLDDYFNEKTRIFSSSTFWRVAQNLVPFGPRFAKYYPDTQIKRKTKQGGDGRFMSTKPARGASGKIEKQKEREEVLATMAPSEFPRKGKI